MRTTRTYTQRGVTLAGEIDTDPTPMAAEDLPDVLRGQRAQWDEVREQALATFADGATVLYAAAPGVPWECADIAALAALTRHERRAASVRWPEDR